MEYFGLLRLVAAATECNRGGATLPNFPRAEPFCGEMSDDVYFEATGEPSSMRRRPPVVAADPYRGPIIPPPSKTCGGKDVVVGWCLADSDLTHAQPPPHVNYTDAQCCAWCVTEPRCVAWNTNAQQVGSTSGNCHSRSTVAAPNTGASCSFGVVRTPPPAPPPPTPIKPAPRGAKNLLVLVTDDFRPFVKPWTSGKYGIKAPNVGRLASESTVFHNAYVQQAVCGPSRNSFLTGKRPDSTNVWTFRTDFRRSGVDTHGTPGAEWQSFPQVFKQNGYNTVGMGKIFHPNSPKANDCANPRGSPPRCNSWSTEFATPDPVDITGLGTIPTPITRCDAGVAGPGNARERCNFTYFQPDSQITNCAFHVDGKVWNPSTCDLPDENCTDLWIADAAARTLASVAADKTKPFAMFVGFHKPHPFWDVPQRFQDEYMRTLPLPTHTDAPVNMPDVAYYSCNSIQGRSDGGGVNCNDTALNPQGCSYIVPNASYAAEMKLNRTSSGFMRTIRAGYAGGITWTDLQIGKVLDALDATGEKVSCL
jgi:iduronate 2-sulfatase